MHFWKTGELVNELATGELLENEKFKYLLGSQVLYTLFIYEALLSIVQINTFFYLECLIVLLIAVYGTLRTYQSNGGSEGDLLLERFAA
ncbi:MAG: hypothetical protein ABW162_17425 [Candidatus Sedimenticola sp. PURPLELP]